MHWLRLRDEERPLIHSVAAHRQSMNAVATEAFQLRVPANTDHVICDTPAAMNKQDLAQLEKDWQAAQTHISTDREKIQHLEQRDQILACRAASLDRWASGSHTVSCSGLSGSQTRRKSNSRAPGRWAAA